MIRQFLKRVRRNRKGISSVEFALIAPVFLLMLLGTMELGYQMYLRNLMTGVLEDAARRAAVGGMSSSQVDTFIRDGIKTLLPRQYRNSGSALQISKRSFHNFSNVAQPEKVTSDTAPIGTYNVGDCYEDANGNNAYDISGGSSGIGGADDVVFYEVTAQFPHLFPVVNFYETSANMEIEVNTLIRNQPFSQQNAPQIRCS